MQKLDSFFSDLIEPARFEVKRGPRPKNGTALTSTERARKTRATKLEIKKGNIAILDMETDPFDNVTKAKIYPFTACLYTKQYGPVIVWETDRKKFVAKLLDAINSLPDSFTIYAHNGGKFDYMFLISELRGTMRFKGRSLMSARIGRHELRDSLHIIPEKLAAWKKDHFDYTKMEKKNRAKFKKQIIDYMTSDCIYLYDIVSSFVAEFGFKISIGQAAATELKKTCKVATIPEWTDAFLRTFFFGGRVECIAGMGHFETDYRGGWKLYDVNSMYPNAMANFKHPIGSEYDMRKGQPGPNTIFLDLNCRNYGALVRRGDDNEADAGFTEGRFKTTIWEYNTALKYGLIENVRINWLVDCDKFSDFASFIVPMYDRRIETKDQLKILKEGTTEYEETKKTDLFLKYLLNNSYGKFAQNPRKFKESHITSIDEMPDGEGWGDLPAYRCEDYWIWERPSAGKMRFNNVGTAASITGAARAILLEAMQKAVDPIYCDTDSLICRDLPGVDLDKSRLGAWDLEAEFDEVIVAGKKLYACKVKGFSDGHDKRIKIRSKGVSGLDWPKMLDLLDGKIIDAVNKAPTLTKTGQQFYMSRRVRATAPRKIRRDEITQTRLRA